MKKEKGFTPLEIKSKTMTYDHSLRKKDFLSDSDKKADLRPDKKSGLSLTGFSLLEILIAITIFSIILTTIYVTFNVGINSYKTIQINLNRYYEINNLLNRMTKDIRNSFLFAKNDCRFIGDKNSMSFFTNQKKEYARIFYKFENNKLLCSYLLGNNALADNDNLDFEVVLSLIKELNFSYGYLGFKNKDIIWQDNWKNKENLPHSIKIDLLVDLGDHQEDLHFIKIINIPLGINEIK